MMRVMVVDDSQVIRNQIETILGQGDYEFVGSAQDGLEAVREFQSMEPHIVTMDLTMPKMDGIETIKRMVKIDPDVRILVISALKDKATAIRALRVGAYGFLAKPFSMADLKEAINELVSDLKT